MNFNFKIKNFEVKIIFKASKSNKNQLNYNLTKREVKWTILKVIKKRDLGINGLFYVVFKNVSVD